jgi:hypothetical protein
MVPAMALWSTYRHRRASSRHPPLTCAEYPATSPVLPRRLLAGFCPLSLPNLSAGHFFVYSRGRAGGLRNPRFHSRIRPPGPHFIAVSTAVVPRGGPWDSAHQSDRQSGALMGSSTWPARPRHDGAGAKDGERAARMLHDGNSFDLSQSPKAARCPPLSSLVAHWPGPQTRSEACLRMDFSRRLSDSPRPKTNA